MKKKNIRFVNILLFLVFLLVVERSNAQPLVYRPVSPSFGGIANNGSWLITQADLQNKYKTTNATPDYNLGNQNAITNFNNSLTQQVLSKITSQFVNDQFSSDLKVGSYNFGNFKVDISNGRNGINIRVIDDAGTESFITVPYTKY